MSRKALIDPKALRGMADQPVSSCPVLAADVERQADVARLSADVLPFSLNATTHVFTKTPGGGVQRVVARSPADANRVDLVREHLRDIRVRFLKGDLSSPGHVHGSWTP